MVVYRPKASVQVAKAAKQKKRQADDQTLWQVFWSGFFFPLKLIWKALAWATHQFPLRPIGHLLRWVANLPPFRFLWRLIGLNYIRASFGELRLVTWPTFRESMRLTGAVIIFSIIFGAIIAVVDYGLDKVFKQLFVK
ncbi:preprotein translocase subunit SecE [Candidatus Saccharibacteria bacterium]|nr:MAG: preprotein translocase subunit SecE [Candidatus Saccharibacteria bacterium]PID99374.1 MAG: preprotein translocase subunit SecE [Candidatus Saccharibacteria bacterium]